MQSVSVSSVPTVSPVFFFYSPLNHSIRCPRLVPFQLNRAGGQGDGARRRLFGWRGGQGVELPLWALTTALPNVQNRD